VRSTSLAMVRFGRVETFQCENKGRGLRTTGGVQPGEELLAEKPLVHTLTNKESRGTRCDYCFADTQPLLHCARCKSARYCNQQCQKGDRAVHKLECKCLVGARQQPLDIIHLVSRIIFKCNGKDNDKNAQFESVIENLASNQELITSQRKEQFFTFIVVLQDYLSACKSITLEDFDVYGLFCRISCSSFTITNAELNTLGIGIYETASLINHSCDPNCVALFNGRDITIRAIKPIPAGDEVTLSYVDIMSPVQARQGDLLEGYMFVCSCHVCKEQKFNDFPMRSFKCGACQCRHHVVTLAEGASQLDSSSIRSCACDSPCDIGEQRLAEINTCTDELNSLYNIIDIVPTPDQLKQLRKWIQRGEKVLGETNIALVRCYERAMDGCVDTEDWSAALSYGRRLEKPYTTYLSKFHPTIGLHYFKLGKLEMLLDNVREGIECYVKAIKVLRKSHGDDHDMVVFLRGSLEEAKGHMMEVEKFKVHQRVYNEMNEGNEI